MNDVIKTILSRSSIRAYSDKRLDEDEIRILQQAALAAPTSLDLQQEYFYFITDECVLSEIEKAIIDVSSKRGEADYLERLKDRGYKVLFGAKLLVVIVVNNENNYIDVDAGIAVQTIALAAKSIGLDSVIMAAPDRIFIGEYSEYFNKMLGIPSGYRFSISIAIGHKAMEKDPHELSWPNIIRI